jgi:TRAP-type uncharacterized transport system fused permease subunit
MTIFVFLKAIVGVFALAVGAQGFFFRNLSWSKRAVFVAGSILVFWPSYLAAAAGVLLVAGMSLWEWRLEHNNLIPKTESR